MRRRFVGRSALTGCSPDGQHRPDPVEVLRTYKNQPYLEKRFSTKKSVLNVAPVFLKSPRRIEAMMFLYFIALMLVSLIERRMRREMQEQHIERLPCALPVCRRKTNLADHHGVVSRRPSSDHRTLRQAYSDRPQRDE